MKVDVAGLVAAAQKLLGLATSAQGLLAEMAPLAADPTSGGAAARLDMASMQLWGAACAQAYSLQKAAGHLIMIAQKFGTREELNAAGLNVLLPGAAVMDDTALATLEPVPLVPPDVRVPIPPGAALSGDPADVRKALLAHPLVGQWGVVEELVDKLLAADAKHLPQFQEPVA